MEQVSRVRRGLESIAGALTDFLPDEGSQGDGRAVVSHLLHRGDGDDQPSSGESSRDYFDREDTGGQRDFEPVFEFGADAEEKLAALGRSAEEPLRRAFELRGIDALGWYSSFHARGIEWGAHVSLSGIAYLVKHAFHLLPVDTETKCRLAFHAILQHELFHFATDYAIAQAELAQQQAWWVPAKHNRFARSAGYLEQEEKLANAWMLKSFRTALPQFRVRGKQEALKKFVRQQPVGYRDGILVRGHSDWIEELHQLAYHYAEDAGVEAENPGLWGELGFSWAALYPIWPRIDWRYCPIHLIDDSERYGITSGWLTFFSFARNVDEHPSFLKSLAKLTPAVQDAWATLKRRLQGGITPGMDFKRWPPGGSDVYSIRLNDNFRVHMRRERERDGWLALEVGSHRALGHG